MTVALITGITGQDGSYLAANLLKKGYSVHGIRRRTSSFNTQRLEDVLAIEGFSLGDVKLHYGDMSDTSSLVDVVASVRPAEVYNLAAMSHVGVSFKVPESTADVNGLGTLRLLEALRITSNSDSRFYQASTSELFGGLESHSLSESDAFHPRSPYAISKLFAFWTVVNFREAYGMYACNGILFNHESPFRGANFVTQKIVRELVQIHQGSDRTLHLGNLNATRDWGHAREYVEMQWRMLQQVGTPRDYVIATGRQASVREFVEICCSILGIRLAWSGEGLDEEGWDEERGARIVAVDSSHFRPAEVPNLLGNASAAQRELGWSAKISLEELAAEMIQLEIARESRQHY